MEPSPKTSEPHRILLDFERAALNAFASHHTGALLKGCYFLEQIKLDAANQKFSITESNGRKQQPQSKEVQGIERESEKHLQQF